MTGGKERIKILREGSSIKGKSECVRVGREREGRWKEGGAKPKEVQLSKYLT